MPRVLLALVLLAFTLLPATSSADPVTFNLSVQITERCVHTVGCEPFEAAFPIAMTIDSTLTGSSDTATSHTRLYGVPMFSPVPLARPPVAEGATPQSVAAVDSVLIVEPFGWRRVGHAYSGFTLGTSEATYTWNTSLFRAEDYLAGLPDMTLASLVEFLTSDRGAGYFGYTYAGFRAGGGYTPDSISYIGRAQLASTDPVPEPATLVLCAAGIGALLTRRKHIPSPRNRAHCGG